MQAIAAHAKALDVFRSGWLQSIEGQVGVTIIERPAIRWPHNLSEEGILERAGVD